MIAASIGNLMAAGGDRNRAARAMRWEREALQRNVDFLDVMIQAMEGDKWIIVGDPANIHEMAHKYRGVPSGPLLYAYTGFPPGTLFDYPAVERTESDQKGE